MKESGLLERGILEAHCALPGDKKNHECCGKVVIRAQGVRLECSKCGSDQYRWDWLPTAEETDLLDAILNAVGMKMDMLAEETQARVVRALRERRKRGGDAG